MCDRYYILYWRNFYSDILYINIIYCNVLHLNLYSNLILLIDKISYDKNYKKIL